MLIISWLTYIYIIYWLSIQHALVRVAKYFRQIFFLLEPEELVIKVMFYRHTERRQTGRVVLRIDLTIQHNLTFEGDQAEAGPNLVYFINKLKSMQPNLIISQPTYGYPQV